MNTILAITAGLLINGIVAFTIAKLSRNLWMVAALVVVYKLLEVATGNYFDFAQVETVSAWVVTAIVGFLLFMITAQIHIFLRDREEEREAEKLENSKV